MPGQALFCALRTHLQSQPPWDLPSGGDTGTTAPRDEGYWQEAQRRTEPRRRVQRAAEELTHPVGQMGFQAADWCSVAHWALKPLHLESGQCVDRDELNPGPGQLGS